MRKNIFAFYILSVLLSSTLHAAETCRYIFADGTVTEQTIKDSINHSTKYLDERNKKWADQQKCLCCHTTLPYVLTRAFDSNSRESFKKFEKSARESTENPNRPPWYETDHAGINSYPTEAVLNALTLIMFDTKQTVSNLRPVTFKAVDRIFEYLDQHGSLHWLDYDLQPFESKQGELWGNSMAVLAIEMAEKNSTYKAPVAKYALLKKMLLDQHATLNLNEKSVLVWAHSMNHNLLTPELLISFTYEIAASQKTSGAWDQKSFIPDGRAEADAYSTSMALIALVKSRTQPDAARKAASWLLSKQQSSQRFGLGELRNFWPSTSMNRTRNFNHLFASDAATGYATLALKIYLEEGF